MTEILTKDEIRDILQDILESDEARNGIRGCHGRLQAYAHMIQRRLVEPILQARGAERDLSLDDLGHDTHFKSCWNRAIRGESETWDCRGLTQVFVGSVMTDPKETWKQMANDDYRLVKSEILENLPDILLGKSERILTGQGLRSWVTNELLHVKMNGDVPNLCEVGCEQPTSQRFTA